jgi:hypothetical protein
VHERLVRQDPLHRLCDPDDPWRPDRDRPPDVPGAVAGTYLGAEDLEVDLDARIRILERAVRAAPVGHQRLGRGVVEGVDCVYANYVDHDDRRYAAHSQLAHVAQPAVGGDPNAAGSRDATFTSLDPDAISVVELTASPEQDRYYAGGAAPHLRARRSVPARWRAALTPRTLGSAAR